MQVLLLRAYLWGAPYIPRHSRVTATPFFLRGPGQREGQHELQEKERNNMV